MHSQLHPIAHHRAQPTDGKEEQKWDQFFPPLEGEEKTQTCWKFLSDLGGKKVHVFLLQSAECLKREKFICGDDLSHPREQKGSAGHMGLAEPCVPMKDPPSLLPQSISTLHSGT